ncbi:MAG: tryptophan 7-halogenase [Deltaproteobacteria bacterium]|nr:tryptophan 7-halogenase [Deltaproteobacteria bacterium]
MNEPRTQLPSTTDIVIAGGGPAGSTIARLLSELGFRVVVCEKRRFPRYQIGESLTPQILPVLDFLGVRARIEAAGFLQMAGHTVCWGTAHPRTSYYSPDHSRRGFQAWREEFDSLLLTHAREGGALVFEQCAVKDIQLTDTGMSVSTSSGPIAAEFFIDASGRAGVFARRTLRQRDAVFQTLAVTGYWRGATGPVGIDFANTLLETYENGLVWSVPLHNGLRNVTLLIDWQLGKRIRRSGLPAFYHAELPQAPYVSQFLRHAQLAGPLRAIDATWHTAKTFAGAQFLLVGDAGMFVDPLSSEGVHKAMASAITGAAVVNTILRRPAMRSHALKFYEESQQQTYSAYYQQSAQYYGEEQRWLHVPFWQRRTQNQSRVLSSESRVPSPEFRVLSPEFQASTQIISQLAIAPGVEIEQRPAIEGPFVELREAVVSPRHPRGVRFLDNMCIPVLVRLVDQHHAVADIMQAYLQRPEGRYCQPEAVRQLLARLYQEGMLIATGPDESRSD